MVNFFINLYLKLLLSYSLISKKISITGKIGELNNVNVNKLMVSQ